MRQYVVVFEDDDVWIGFYMAEDRRHAIEQAVNECDGEDFVVLAEIVPPAQQGAMGSESAKDITDEILGPRYNT